MRDGANNDIAELVARLDGPHPRAALVALDARRAELEASDAPLALDALSRRAIALGEAASFAELCKRRLDEKATFALAVEYAQALRFAGNGELAATVVRGGLQLFSDADGPVFRARLLRESAFVELAEGHFTKAIAQATKALEIAESCGSVPLHARCLLALGLVERYRGRIAEGLDLAYRALALPGIEASVDVLLETLGYTTIAHLDRGQEDVARELLERARALRSEAPESQWIVPAVAEANIAHVDGRFDEADLLYEEATAACVRWSFREVELRVLVCRAVLELERDRPARAGEHIARMRERVEDSGLLLLSIAATLLHLAVEATLGRSDAVRAELEGIAAVGEMIPKKGLVARLFDAMMLLVESRLESPDVDAVARRLARITSRSEEGERWLNQSADLRGLLRAAARPLEKLGLALPAETRPDRLVVDGEAKWFRIGDGPRFTIEDRPMFRGILLELTRERVEHPGRTVPRERLFAAGWPGDKAAAASMQIRLRVAMSNLRKLGLGAAARASRGGFLLDPSLDVAFE